jgi:ferritin-like metal-binding protein YciE
MPAVGSRFYSEFGQAILLKEPSVKVFSAHLDNLNKLYVNQIHMLLSTEQQITKALPTMIDKATDTQLKQAFQSHLQETRVHIERLETILNESGEEPKATKCKVLEALVEEAEDLVGAATDESVRDAALISAAQRVEHYEIAVYGAVRNFAQLLGKPRQADLLDRTANEEGHADHLLTEISNRLNAVAQRAA